MTGECPRQEVRSELEPRVLSIGAARGSELPMPRRSEPGRPNEGEKPRKTEAVEHEGSGSAASAIGPGASESTRQPQTNVRAIKAQRAIAPL